PTPAAGLRGRRRRTWGAARGAPHGVMTGAHRPSSAAGPASRPFESLRPPGRPGRLQHLVLRVILNLSLPTLRAIPLRLGRTSPSPPTTRDRRSEPAPREGRKHGPCSAFRE